MRTTRQLASVALFLPLIVPSSALGGEQRASHDSSLPVVRTWKQPDKTDPAGGMRRVEVVFDYRMGVARRRVFDERGRVVSMLTPSS